MVYDISEKYYHFLLEFLIKFFSIVDFLMDFGFIIYGVFLILEIILR